MQILKYCNQKGAMVDTEIPKVTDDMVSGDAVEKEEGKPFMLFGREVSRKRAYAVGAGVLCAALLIGGGGYAIAHAGWAGKSNTPAVSQTKDEEKQDTALVLEVKADGWDADTSTPVIAHIEDEDGEVDFYTAIAANKRVTVKVGKSGTYTVTLIPPVNADGSTYKAASSKVKAGKDDKKTNGTVITLEKVDADKVTKDDLTAIAKDVAAAVKKSDSTLTGDKGAEVVKKFEDNIKKNPNADTDAVEKETGKAEETAKEDKSDAKTPETSDNKKNDSGSKNDSGNNGSGNKSDSKPSGSNNSSNSGSSSKKDDTTAHQHKWVAQTKTVHHDAQYKTVHHDAQYKTVHHDAVTKTVNICNQCGQDITGNEAAHFKAAALSGGNCQSCHSETRTVQAAYDEQVKVSDAYDEQVQVSAAWDETVTTGYKCSSCGATK